MLFRSHRLLLREGARPGGNEWVERNPGRGEAPSDRIPEKKNNGEVEIQPRGGWNTSRACKRVGGGKGSVHPAVSCGRGTGGSEGARAGRGVTMRPQGQTRHEAGHGVVLSGQSSHASSASARASMAPASRTRASVSSRDRARRMGVPHAYLHPWGAASLAWGT